MRTPRSEAGFALIEVIVSAAVLAVVALAVLSGIDAANSTSARDKARAVAASLAEKDQERLRTMPVDMLKNPPQQPDVTVDGVTYKTESTARWITDDIGGEPECGTSTASGENNVQYLQITTTVKSKVVGSRIPPVTVDSLVAPTTEWVEGHGSLGVKVTDRNKAGVKGITVAATSAAFSPPAQSTDKDGCVIWKSVPIGSYTLTLNTPAYLDRDGNQLTTANQTVVAKKVNFAAMTYDRAVDATVNVTTHRPGGAWAAPGIASRARNVSAVNGQYVGLLKKFAPATGTTATTFPAPRLFPFAENYYSFFTGGCGYANPEAYKSLATNKDYFTAVNAGAALLADPTKVSPPVAVRQPPFNLRITRNRANTTPSAGQIDVYAFLQPTTGDTCAEARYQLTPMAYPTAAPWLPIPKTGAGLWLSASSTAYDPGMPFGEYKLCLVDRSSGTRGAVLTSTYDNRTPTGTQTTLDLDLRTASTAGWTTGNTCTTA